MDKIPLRKRELERAVIMSIALATSALFLWMIADFLAMLFLAMVLTAVLQPAHDRLSAKLGGKPRLSVALLVSASILAIVIPAVLIFMVVLDESLALANMITPFVRRNVEQFQELQAHGGPVLQSAFLRELPPDVQDDIIDLQATLVKQVGDLAKQATPLIVNSLKAGSGTIGGVLSGTLSFFFLMYALVFFLLNGRNTFQNAASLLPLPRHHRELMVNRAHATILAVAKGTMLLALLQGVLMGTGLYVTGVPLAFFWGFLAALFSFIPVLGPPLIWAPAAGWLYASGKLYEAIALGVWGMLLLVIALMLRPVLVGKDAKMSDLMVLISSLGGLTLFGGTGIFIGPMLGALVEAAWYLFGQAYEELLDENLFEPARFDDEYEELVSDEQDPSGPSA